jgi:hypothetical protein
MVGSLIAGLLALKGVLFLARASLITIALAAKLVAGVTAMLNISTGLLALKYAGLIAVGGVLFAMFRKVGMVLSAVHEALSSYDPKTGLWTIARKTYDELQKSGLMGLFEKLLETTMKLKLMFEGKLSLEKAFPSLFSLRKFLIALGDAFVYVVDAMLGIMPAANRTNDGFSTAGSNAPNLSVAIGRVGDAADKLAQKLHKELPDAIATTLEFFADVITFGDYVVRYALNPLIFAASGAASAFMFLGAAMAAVAQQGDLADKLGGMGMDLAKKASNAFTWYNPERGEDGTLASVTTLRKRAAELRAFGMSDVAEERGRFPAIDETTGLSTYTANGRTVRAPIYGEVGDREGVGASWMNPTNQSTMPGGSAATYNQPWFKSLEKMKINNNITVNLDGKQVASAVSAKKEVEADRSGDTVGGPTPMNNLMTAVPW